MSSCYSWTMPSTAETEEMVPAWSRTRKAHGDHTKSGDKNIFSRMPWKLFMTRIDLRVAALCETAVMSRSRHEAMVDSSLVELMKGDASERERRVLRRHGCIPRRV